MLVLAIVACMAYMTGLVIGVMIGTHQRKSRIRGRY